MKTLIIVLFYCAVFASGIQPRKPKSALPPKRAYISQALRVSGGDVDEVWPLQPDISGDEPAEASSTSPPIQQHSPRFLGFTVSELQTAAATRSAQVGANLKKQLDAIRKTQASLSLPKVPEDWKGQSTKAIQNVGPAAVAAAGLLYKEGELSFLGVYALALLGSCSGFHLFLYFITVGYSLGVMLPVLVALYVASKRPVQNLTAVHSCLTILWGVRSAAFFLYREYVNWPQLHDKVVEVNNMARLNSKFFCWLVYSFFYATMVSPCLFRLKSATTTTWGVFGKIALGMQVTGLLLESVADYQKSTFKALPGNRNQWCNVGLFQYSTFPNYLGEIMFWYGTFFGGMASYKKPQQWVLALIGILFVSVVIKGAVSSLGAKQMRKYGDKSDFIKFRRTHTFLGPVPSFEKKQISRAINGESQQPAF